MLVMRRREGEAILIGDNVEIRILSINRTKVKIGITAPRSVSVTAHEIELVRTENLAAAQALKDAPGMVARLLQAFTKGTAENAAEMADGKHGRSEV
jgi:carbon storage regulator